MGIFKNNKVKNSTITMNETVQTKAENTTMAEIKTVNTSGYMQILEYMCPVQVKKITESAKLPTRGSAAAAGYDVYAWLNGGAIDIPPHETKMIKTGLAFAIPKGHFLGIYPRSGLASKQGLRPANCVGVVDADYRGEVMVALHNDSDKAKTIKHGERIAQLILQEYKAMNFIEVENLDETERGEGGFGSTGNK